MLIYVLSDDTFILLILVCVWGGEAGKGSLHTYCKSDMVHCKAGKERWEGIGSEQNLSLLIQQFRSSTAAFLLLHHKR